MSGISGIWHLDGKPLSHPQVKAVADALLHRGPNGTAHWIEGAVGLSASVLRVTTESLTEVQPVVDASGCVLVFDGRIDNRSELISELTPAEGLLPSSPDSLLALLAYLHFGKSFPARIIGDFALALFDPRVQELLVVRDAIGIRPLYFYKDSDLFVFGSEVKALLAHPGVKTKPNESYLSISMMGGSPPADASQTLFDNIFSLAPSNFLTVTKHRVTRTKYWEFDLRRQIRHASIEPYIEGFRHYFRQAVYRRLRSAFPVAITVSGGLDSSSIFCIAQNLRKAGDLPCPEVVGITQESSQGTPSYELDYIRAIERQYGVKIERIPLEYRPLLEGIRTSIRTMESPEADVHWYNNAALRRAATHADARSMLSGHWGDQVFFQQAYLVDLFRSFQWGQLKAHLQEFSHWVDVDSKWFRRIFFRDMLKKHVPRILRPPLAKIRSLLRRPTKDYPWFTDDFRDLATRSMSRYHPPTEQFANMHVRGVFEEVRAKYYVQAMEWCNKAAAISGIDQELPVLDRDFLGYLMSIPGEVLSDQGVHRGLLRKAMKGILPDEILDRRSKADFSLLENQTVARQFGQTRNFFFADAKEIYSRGYVNRKVLEAEFDLLREKLSGDCVAAWSITDLMALEIWLQEFFVTADEGRI